MAAKKKKSAPAERELKATVKKLRSKLERADARADRWKKKAGQLEKAAGAAEAQVKKLSKRVKRLESQPGQGAAAPLDAPPVSTGLTASEPLDTSAQPTRVPNDSWTVIQLRAEARARGLTGLSGKSKAELLAALD